jgi:hypothetical protein
MDRSTYFLNKAEQCRRLAATVTARDDPAIQRLLALAAGYETLAIESAAREARSRLSKPNGADAE